MTTLVVLSDGETWEVLNKDILVVELSKRGFKQLKGGTKFRHPPEGEAQLIGDLQDLVHGRKAFESAVH